MNTSPRDNRFSTPPLSRGQLLGFRERGRGCNFSLEEGGRNRESNPTEEEAKIGLCGLLGCFQLESLPALDGLSKNRNATSAERSSSAVFSLEGVGLSER